MLDLHGNDLLAFKPVSPCMSCLSSWILNATCYWTIRLGQTKYLLDFGLTASVWTADIDRGRALLPKIEAGTVFLNRADFLDPLLAWTGVKDSGKGVSLSALGFHSVTKPKSYHLRLKIE